VANTVCVCRLKTHVALGGARAVILAPTRELTLQTYKVVKELGRNTTLRVAAVVGGDSMEAQFEELVANPDIIVATPGKHWELYPIPPGQCTSRKQMQPFAGLDL
jgi:superfamily II DNA/RNA helicase